MKDRLEDLALRIERLGAGSRASPSRVDQFLAPMLRALSWKPDLDTYWLGQLSSSGQDDDFVRDRSDWSKMFLRALGEAETNVRRIERATAVDGAPPIAHVAWCWRVYQVLTRAQEQLLDNPARYRLSPSDAIAALPPLVVDDPSTGRELHVGSVDALLRAADEEAEHLGRRRRFLEAARKVLLDSSAALPLDAMGVERRQHYIAREIARINRFEARGLSTRVSLMHQARQALSRGDAQRLHAALAAIHGGAERSGDSAIGRASEKALDALWKQEPRFTSDASARSLSASAADIFDDEVREAIARGYREGRRKLAEAPTDDVTPGKHLFQGQARRYLESAGPDATLFAALGVDGCFDVGGTLSPVRVVEEDRVLRTVTYPTRDLMLLPAQSVNDVPDAVIDDPRLIAFNLATGRLLARRFVAEEIRRRERSVLASEVRVYVLDGSGSMLGPRSRMRDAILVTELSTLRARYHDARRTLNPTLYYRYFTKKVGPTHRVASSEEALDAIESVLSEVHTGGTDIEGALLASFDQIRKAQREDPDLARAQIVLVTDGEADVDAAKMLRARRSVGDLPIGVSIIALGEENPALRRLAAEQRAAGEQVFYHFLDDLELDRIIQGRDAGLPIHLPHLVNLADLSAELDALLTEMEDLTRTRDRALFDEAVAQQAFDEVGLRFDRDAGDHLRAQAAASRRDHDAVRARFERWFPDLSGQQADPVLVPSVEDREELEVVQTLLASTLEVVELVGADELGRRVDAIEVLERLLLDRGMTPWRYADLCRRYVAVVRPFVEAVRSACGIDGPNAPRTSGSLMAT